jgi:hypothetical protein
MLPIPFFFFAAAPTPDSLELAHAALKLGIAARGALLDLRAADLGG